MADDRAYNPCRIAAANEASDRACGWTFEGIARIRAVAQNRAIFAPDVPADFWAELKHDGLLREDAPTL